MSDLSVALNGFWKTLLDDENTYGDEETIGGTTLSSFGAATWFTRSAGFEKPQEKDVKTDDEDKKKNWFNVLPARPRATTRILLADAEDASEIDSRDVASTERALAIAPFQDTDILNAKPPEEKDKKKPPQRGHEKEAKTPRRQLKKSRSAEKLATINEERSVCIDDESPQARKTHRTFMAATHGGMQSVNSQAEEVVLSKSESNREPSSKSKKVTSKQRPNYKSDARDTREVRDTEIPKVDSLSKAETKVARRKKSLLPSRQSRPPTDSRPMDKLLVPKEEPSMISDISTPFLRKKRNFRASTRKNKAPAPMQRSHTTKKESNRRRPSNRVPTRHRHSNEFDASGHRDRPAPLPPRSTGGSHSRRSMDHSRTSRSYSTPSSRKKHPRADRGPASSRSGPRHGSRGASSYERRHVEKPRSTSHAKRHVDKSKSSSRRMYVEEPRYPSSYHGDRRSDDRRSSDRDRSYSRNRYVDERRNPPSFSSRMRHSPRDDYYYDDRYYY